MPLCRREGLSSLFHSWGNWGVGKLKDLPGHTQCLNSTLTWVDFPYWCFNLLRLILFLPPLYSDCSSSCRSGGFASCDYRNNIHLLYAIPLRVSPGKTYSLNYVTVSFCCKGACNCCSQRETISDLHQSITTALCYIHVSHFSLYCLFSLIFCLLGPCSRTKYWQIVLHLAPVLVEPFSVRAVSNCSLWLWKYHLCNFFSSPEVQSKENWKNCECLHGL